MAKSKQSDADDCVESLARDIYARCIAAGGLGKTHEHLAAESIRAAEAFQKVASERPNTG